MNDRRADPTARPPMLADIARQPQALRDLAARSEELADFCACYLSPDSGGRIVAFGSGDGWFAARAAAAGGQCLDAASGLELMSGLGPRWRSKDRAVAVSMSGNVDRTVAAAASARHAAVTTVALTNGSGGRLGAQGLGLPCFNLDLPDIAPFLCGTCSFLSTYAALTAIDALAGGATPQTIAAGLNRTADALLDLLPVAEAVAQTVAYERAGQSPGVRLLSCGQAGLAIADYGAAKFVELTRTPVWTDDIEEFAHRQYWSTARGELIVFLPTAPSVARVADAAATALTQMDMATLAIAPRPLALQSATWCIDWPPVQGVPPLALAILALQYLGYYWALHTGLDPNTRQHLKQDTTRFRVSRLLTRRTLLDSGQ